ncbi:hypothetical protein JCM9534A_06970 [Catenuloplanes indicus JCM 9534]
MNRSSSPVRCTSSRPTATATWPGSIAGWDGAGLRLVADNDLTYHHCVEVTFTDAVWSACADLFHHPVFRPATPSEIAFARQVTAAETHHVFAWDAETAAGTVAMMVVAQSVQITEGVRAPLTRGCIRPPDGATRSRDGHVAGMPAGTGGKPLLLVRIPGVPRGPIRLGFPVWSRSTRWPAFVFRGRGRPGRQWRSRTRPCRRY